MDRKMPAGTENDEALARELAAQEEARAMATATATPLTASAATESSLYPSAKVELETGNAMGVASLDPNTPTVVEMTPIHEIKTDPTIVVPPALQQQQPTVATTLPTVATLENPIYLQEKLGAKCCGCCCDYRRAVIIINGVLIGICTFLIMVGRDMDELVYSNDDAMEDEISDLIQDHYSTRAIFLGIVMVTAVIAQAGAVHFNIAMVALHILSLFVEYIANIFLTLKLADDLQDIDQPTNSPIPGFVFNGAFIALFLYPHFGYIAEVRAGILTKETYPREEFSCCCPTANQRQREMNNRF